MSETLLAVLRREGGVLAELSERSADRSPDQVTLEGASPGQIAAQGPRATGHEAEYELMLEMIFEGSLMHYGRSRVLHIEDPDLALLAGDRLYALGLARLASLGDMDAVAELADVIALVAQAHVAADPELAEAVWEAGATAVGWGGGPEYEAAKALARAGEEGAKSALRALVSRSS